MSEERQARRMSDRSAWFTPAAQVPFRLTADYLDSCPIGTVLSVPAGFPKAGEGEPIMLSVEKVSDRKWRVHTRSGFDRRHLVGLLARRRQRRENVRQ
jgi:hypothetical protein